MSKKVAIYATERSLDAAQKRKRRLLKYCKWAERWTTHTSWGAGYDPDDFKWFVRRAKRRKGPVDLIFWTISDIPRGISLQKLKAYAKGGEVHFVKEKLIF